MATLMHVHQTREPISTIELTPPHDPRTETEEYKRARSFLINRKNAPCHICGVTKRTLKNAARNPCGATQMEAHHYPIERSLATACDPVKVHADYPQVYDLASLMAFVDSPANLICLCDVHHRSVAAGIHHLLPQDWIIQRYLRAGYVVAATPATVAAAQIADERIAVAAGIEQTGASPA
jgi:hypothetical protein